MESESKNQVPSKSHENDFLLKWGNRKRSRWVKTKEKEPSLSPCNQQNKNFESVATTMTSNGSNDTKSPEPEERYYLTRGCVIDDNRKGLSDYPEEKVFVWPRFFISLSNKEKEDDFMVLKGCKLPQRPRKRAKIIQRTLLLLSPGAWLSDLCQERYEVREKKKSSKKRPRGLKAMNSMESDSD